MALSATAITEIRFGGSDTLNGGVFNSNASFTSNGAVSSANTASPVLSSVSYTFVAGDVGAWAFIQSGTNSIPGWYQIASVAGGNATLSAAIGAARLLLSNIPSGVSTVAGCGTAASLTSISWGVDYSQQNAPQYSLTGLTTAAANAIILTGSASVNMIGNGLFITAGTNFTTGVYQVNSVSAGVSITVDRTCTSAAGVAGTAGVGGGFASPGFASSISPSSGLLFLNYNASAFSITSATTNIAAGCIAAAGLFNFVGYDTTRTVANTDANRPTIQTNVSTATQVQNASTWAAFQNVIFDGNSQTASKVCNGSVLFHNCQIKNFNTANGGNPVHLSYCTYTGNSVALTCGAFASEFYANTATPVAGVQAGGDFVSCLFYANTGATTDGCSLAATQSAIGCVAYNNGRDGFTLLGNRQSPLVNCISTQNGRYGANNGTGFLMFMVNFATFNNTSGATNGTPLTSINPITMTGDPFTNASGNVFSLNSTAGAGALLRALGFPATFPRGLTPSYLDVGAAQHQDSGGTTIHMVNVNQTLFFADT